MMEREGASVRNGLVRWLEKMKIWVVSMDSDGYSGHEV